MWLMTTKGFYSVVEKTPGKFEIRARWKRDLENLRSGMAWDKEIVATPRADYQFRIRVNRTEAVAAVTWLATQIDYKNFKSAVHDAPGQENKYGPYMSIWGTMNSAACKSQKPDSGGKHHGVYQPHLMDYDRHSAYVSAPARARGVGRTSLCSVCRTTVDSDAKSCPQCGETFE